MGVWGRYGVGPGWAVSGLYVAVWQLEGLGSGRGQARDAHQAPTRVPGGPGGVRERAGAPGGAPLLQLRASLPGACQPRGA